MEAKEQEKKMKYEQLCYELRTQSPGWRVEIVPLVIGFLGNVQNL